MSARSRGTTDELNLSLTGSQISAVSSRTSSARQIRRPNSMIETRDRTAGAKPTTKKVTTNRISAKLKGSSKVPTSQQNSIGAQASLPSNAVAASDPGDEFLALFESTVQPKIRTSSKKSRNAPTGGVKVLWSTPPQKGLPISSRSSSTVHSEVRGDGDGGPSSVYSPWAHTDSDGSSPEEIAQELQDQLSQSLRDIRELSEKLSVNGPKPSSHSSENTNGASGFSSMKKSLHPGVEGIANNMTLQGMSPKTKVSLSSIENIKHKTPINQMMKGASNSHIGRNVTDDYMKTLHAAATKIQRWYRRHMVRRCAGKAAVKRLLQQKKVKIEDIQRESLNFAIGLECEEQKLEDRKRIREEKAKKARQQAIENLHKKREDKKKEVKKKAEEEIAFLQASGKISKTPSGSRKGSALSRTQNKTPKSPQTDSDTDRLSSRKTTPREEGSIDGFLQSPTSNGHEAGKPEDLDDLDHTLVPSEVTTKSTLNDLLDTLRKLEQDEHLLSARQKKNNSWVDGLDRESSHDDSEVLTMENLEKHNPPKEDLTNKSTFLTDDKLQSIMNFLDEVQVADRLTNVDQELSKINDELEKPALLFPAADELAEIEQAQTEVTNTVLAQRLDLEEKRRTVGMLQKALNQQRELTVRHAKETEKEMKRRLDLQKEEYEETIKRHLGFIDQLIDDKKSLSEKCEELVKELKTCDRKYQDKIRSTDDRHSIEMNKLKDMHEAAEKLRREKWIQDKTKKIKEMTVKGLEPEIQRLIAKHKTELKKVKQIHEAELLESDERAAQRYVKMTEELRDQLAKEKEAACARERELSKQRYEKQLQQEEEAYQQQRRRLYSEIQEEKERLATHGSRQRSELDKQQRQLEDHHRIALDAMRSEFEKSREEQERRHAAEIRDLQEKLKVEKESWEENYMKKKDTWLVQKERELKEAVRKDRDKEIEMVISRLEADATTAMENSERTSENKIRRIREKYEAEIRDLEHTEKQALEKYTEMKGRVAEVEGENECFKVQLRQKDHEIETLQKLTDKMHEERNRVSDIIRQEFADRLVTTEEENKRIKTEMSELRARHRIELDRSKEQIEDIKKQKEEELEEVHKRVKQAIIKKEEVVTQLKEQYQAALKRADHLEGLLQQQRKKLLAK